MKREMVSYSSERISQLSRRLATPRNPVDKENTIKSLLQRRMSAKRK